MFSRLSSQTQHPFMAQRVGFCPLTITLFPTGLGTSSCTLSRGPRQSDDLGPVCPGETTGSRTGSPEFYLREPREGYFISLNV